MQYEATIKVWDIGVRVFHWSLVAFFAIAYITGEIETEDLHAFAGYVIIGLLAFRFIWGLIGTRYARFADFIYSPAEIIAYLKGLIARHPKHYFGHNPAGGLMVIIMLVVLVAISWTGLELYAVEGHGPLARAELSLAAPVQANGMENDDEHEGMESEEEEFWEEVHEASVYFMLLLIALHVAGVVVSSIIHGENLVHAMVTGRKPKPLE